MGVIHFDAGVIIGLLDTDDAHHQSARQHIAKAVDDNHQLGISASALAECLVTPAQRGAAAVQAMLGAIRRLPATVVALETEIAVEAARLRADHRSLRLPDALVIATAVVSKADVLVTTDRRWPSADKLGVSVEIRLA